jgi:acyl-CoA dehydrogenase
MNQSEQSHVLTDLARQIFKATMAIPLHEQASGSQLDDELWRTITQSGLEGLLASPEEWSLRDTASVLHHAGYCAARVPLMEAMIAHWIAMQAGWTEESALPVVTLDRQPSDLTIITTNGVLSVSGSLLRVPWGRYATAVYILDQGHIVRIGTEGAQVEHAENLAGEPRDTLIFGAAQASRSIVEVEADDVLARSALLRAALMVGAMERALELALEHAATRVQFGKPIGRFQAVQQLLARLAAAVAAAAAAVDLGAAQGTPFAAAVAKSRVGEAAGLSAEIAHQVIAAMGFTLEHPLHLVTRRLWSWRDESGNETYWNTRLGKTADAAQGDGLWPLLTQPAAVLC